MKELIKKIVSQYGVFVGDSKDSAGGALVKELVEAIELFNKEVGE